MRILHRRNSFVRWATPRPHGTLRAKSYSVFSILPHFIMFFNRFFKYCAFQILICRGSYKVKKCGDIFEKLSPHPQKTFKSGCKSSREVRKNSTKLRANRDVWRCQTSHNDFAHTFAKSVICYYKV